MMMRVKKPRLRTFLVSGLCSIVCPVLLSACAVSHTPKSSAVFRADSDMIAMDPAQGADYYKFESKNSKFANLGQYDASLNTAYLRNRVAMKSDGIREDARSRFNPQISNSKISNTTLLRDFMTSYGKRTDTLKPRTSHSNSDATQKDLSSTHNQNLESEIAFVKINGQTDVRDWQACAESSDGVFDEAVTDFKLKSSFETCMYERGYQSEAQALETLTSKPQSPNMSADMSHLTYPPLKGFSKNTASFKTAPLPDVRTDQTEMSKEGLDSYVLAGGL